MVRKYQPLILFFSGFVLSASLYAGPQDGKITLGDGDITSEGSITTINQHSPRMAIDWGSFNTTAEESITFVQPAPSALVLNRDYSGLPSELLGSLNANGHVLILNQQGILIGESASIQVGSLLATDLSVEINDFAEGDFTLFDENAEAGGIANLGEIQSVAPNGIYLLGQFIDNRGNIVSSNGNQHLAIADSLVITTSEDGLIGVEVSTAIKEDISNTGNLINNTGDILAFNGNIYLDLYYSDRIKAETVNNQGMVSAVAITENSGQIFLTPKIDTDADTDTANVITEVETIVSENQASDSGITSEPITIEITPKPAASLDAIMPTCVGDNMSEENCQKYNAIKRYLGRLLLGGGLPEPE